ncbi:MAG: ribonuclease P protein component [Kiloniellaceae bacterium]
MMPTVGRLKTRPQFLKVAAARRKWVTPGLVLQAARRQHGEDRAASDARTESGSPPEGISGDEAAVKTAAEEEDAEVRVGFTVTRKVGNAVERNRVKRRLRAAAAEVFPRVGRAGTDYVVIGRAATLKRPFDALRGDLEQAVAKLDNAGKRRPGRDGARDGGKHADTREASQ